MAACRLPTYQQASGADPATQQRSDVLPTLFLKGCEVSSLEQPQNTLYELSSAPAEAATHRYDIYKICKDAVRIGHARRLHIYRFTSKPSFSLFSPRERVVIEGKSNREGTCQEVTLTTSSSKWENCSTQGLFTASTSKLNKFKNFSGLVWLDRNGNITALESQTPADDGYLPSTESRLNIQETLSVAEMDLLVACWMARFHMEMKRKAEMSRPSARISILKQKQRNVEKLGAGGATFL